MRTHFPHRSIHLVDIENLLGDARPGSDAAAACRAQYEDVVGRGEADLVVVACNHGAAVDVGLTWSSARLAVRSGPSGADLALLEVIEREQIESRFDRVVIASGDGIFADAAADLAGQGLPVTVVSRRASLSRRLRLAATDVTYFPVPGPPDCGVFEAVA